MSSSTIFLTLPRDANLSELEELVGESLNQAFDDLAKKTEHSIGGVWIHLRSRPKRLHFYFDAYPSDWGIAVTLTCRSDWNFTRMGIAFDIFRRMFWNFKGDYLCWHIEGPVIFCSHNERVWVNSEILKDLGAPPYFYTNHPVVYTSLPSVGESGHSYISSLFDKC